MKKKLKVAVIFNEANPELYIKKPKEFPSGLTHVGKNTNFVPYFEYDNLTPIEEYELMASRLNQEGVEAYVLNIKDDIDVLLKNIKKHKPDVVFNFVEVYKDNARLEMNMVGLLELLGIPYTGAPPMALANCQSKVLTKRLLNAVGILTPQFIVFRHKLTQYKHKLQFPLIIKPAFEDASAGIENESIVMDNKELKDRINYVLKYFDQPALVEEFIEGRELNVAVMGDKDSVVLPISEIDFSEMPEHLHNIVSYQAKWDPHNVAYHKTIPICPAVLTKRIEEKVHSIAIKAFKTMGCRDYARVDMRLSKDKKIYVLEVNPNPDLTEGAGFMRSAEAAGYSYTTTLKKIINYAWKRRKNVRNFVK